VTKHAVSMMFYANTFFWDTRTHTRTYAHSLFPKGVQDRLFRATEESKKNKKSISHAPKYLLQTFLTDESVKSGQPQQGDMGDDGVIMYPGQVFKTKPIADLFLECTVLFADISGFTAWSSVREPSQVFALLECIYNTFDGIARRNKVFKVETIGDCYVAVCGLPEANADHAIVMAQFAHSCRIAMRGLMQHLEVTLGPDTSELAMRFGLHSGPVTAGVLRGEKSRFQLFGDTVNTAARMESKGERNRVHCSEVTAMLLMAAGLDHWIQKREETVMVKGKGEMQTYWLRVKANVGGEGASGMGIGGSAPSSIDATGEGGVSNWIKSSLTSRRSSSEMIVGSGLHPRSLRLVDWVANLMLPMLEEIVAHRQAIAKVHQAAGTTKKGTIICMDTFGHRGDDGDGFTVLDEVQEVIYFPQFDAKVAEQQALLSGSVQLARTSVDQQLRVYVKALATMYQDNPFHNFEHATHVTMSVGKLLSRIVAPEVVAEGQGDYDSQVHDHTYGITSDPLIQFAVVFSALIHDVDHPGVPNAVLVKEGSPLAAHYHLKSVAEQNSVDVAWKLSRR
jgi:class 3 adenylate cyclase